MEVFFQSGEFYNENNFLLELLQIIIPTLAAIAAALLPFWCAKRHERKKEFNNFKNLECYFYALLSNVVDKIKDQIIHIEKVIDTLEKKDFFEFRLTIVSGFLFDKIKQITNQEKIYQLFVLGKATTFNNNQNSLIKTFNAIESTETNINSLYGHLNKFNKRYTEYQGQWNENGNSFIRRFEDDFVKLVKNQYGDSTTFQYFEQLNKIINEWRKLNDTSIAITYEKLIEPARKLSDKFRHPVYLPPIMECVAAYDNIEKLKKDYVETFAHIKNALVNNHGIITTEMQNIKDIPLKPASKWI